MHQPGHQRLQGQEEYRVDDKQRQMSDAEVVTTALVAMLYFGGNFERARARVFRSCPARLVIAHPPHLR